ncbi:methyltransferase domain-containing protein [Paenibacillus sp. MSJ-34]|uniref:methyltransferase domain-containing protein n=1 Tax=Paenibacillus sp. MSJ-34 TaxID=2841529 RepID=UPI003460E030
MNINEAAKQLNITARAIRFYEQKGLVSPHKHPDNQYRQFTEQDIERLRTIAALREIGVGLEGIKSILLQMEQGNQTELQYYLETQRNAMFSQWIELRQLIAAADTMIERLKRQDRLHPDEIHKLAAGLRGLKEARGNWKDQWGFDEMAPDYDDLVLNEKQIEHTRFNPHEDYDQVLDLVVEWVAPSPGDAGLDLGIGTGNLAGRFLRKNITMMGLDQSREMLKQCRRKYPDLETKLGNLLAVPFFDGQFDFVVSSYALHHLTAEQKRLALGEMSRVLKPKGKICIADLMFENEQARTGYMDRLREAGHWEAVDSIESEYYADRSQLIRWLREYGFATVQHRVNDLMHLVYGERN